MNNLQKSEHTKHCIHSAREKRRAHELTVAFFLQKPGEIHNCFVQLKYLPTGGALFCLSAELLILHKDSLWPHNSTRPARWLMQYTTPNTGILTSRIQGDSKLLNHMFRCHARRRTRSRVFESVTRWTKSV